VTDDTHSLFFSSMSHALCCMKGTYVNKTLECNLQEMRMLFCHPIFETNWMRTWGTCLRHWWEDILKGQNNSLLWKFCAPWAINPLMWETLKMAVCACHSYETIMVQNYSNFDSRCLNHDCFKQVSQNISIFVVVCFWKGTISFGKIRQTLWNRLWHWM